MRITSTENARIKEVLSLRRRAAREQIGAFLVEGAREIERALAAGLQPRAFFFAPFAAQESASAWERRARESGGERFEVTDRVYQKIAMRAESDGVIAVFTIPPADLASWSLPGFPLVLVAVGIEKPGNLGALARSVDALGADGLIVAGGTDLWNPNAVRASVGSLFGLRLAVLDEARVVPELRARGLRLVAAIPSAETAADAANLAGSVALLVGSEDAGLPAHILNECDERVRIPMHGKADSLNVSVTAAILLYEAARQRRRTP